MRTKFPCHRLYNKKIRAVRTLVATPHRKDRTGLGGSFSLWIFQAQRTIDQGLIIKYAGRGPLGDSGGAAMGRGSQGREWLPFSQSLALVRLYFKKK